MSIQETCANNFWQLENLITGFAVTEALVVTLAVASRTGELVRNLDHVYRRRAASLLTMVFHSLVCLAVWRCHEVQLMLLATNDPYSVI
jgi:hypothetical protein